MVLDRVEYLLCIEAKLRSCVWDLRGFAFCIHCIFFIRFCTGPAPAAGEQFVDARATMRYRDRDEGGRGNGYCTFYYT
jgi:hypothetical protein